LFKTTLSLGLKRMYVFFFYPRTGKEKKCFILNMVDVLSKKKKINDRSVCAVDEFRVESKQDAQTSSKIMCKL
jgi:hypothetical protein